MTEKELHKLRRHDLLQLLLAQGREAAQLQDRIRELTESQGQLQQANDRFIERLDDKDAQIQRLKDRLDEKDITRRFWGGLSPTGRGSNTRTGKTCASTAPMV